MDAVRFVEETVAKVDWPEMFRVLPWTFEAVMFDEETLPRFDWPLTPSEPENVAFVEDTFVPEALVNVRP